MPLASYHPVFSSTKAILMGDSGGGKTSALSSLVEAGYKVRVLDLDNGLDFLINKLRRRSPSSLDNLSYATICENFEIDRSTGQARVSASGLPTPPIAAATVGQLFDRWYIDGAMARRLRIGEPLLSMLSEEPEDFGPVVTWGQDCVLVIDSLTQFAEAVKRQAFYLNGRTAENARQSDWGTAIHMLENFLNLVTSAAVKCNVLVLSHVKYLSDEQTGGLLKVFPQAIGQYLPANIGKWFNAILHARRVGSGDDAKYVITTRSHGLFDLKSADPSVPAELPNDSGLATYFNLVRQISADTASRS